jgi:DNA-binding response OmpR family regulator
MKPFSVKTNSDVLRDLIHEQTKRHPSWKISDDPQSISIDVDALGLKLPLRLGTLIDKINYALSDRTKFAPDDTAIYFGSFCLSDDGQFFADTNTNKKISVTDKEYLILRLLISESKTGIDRAHLLKQVWGYADTAETHTIETHMYRLRQKLDDTFGNKIEIINQNGSYKIITP